MYYAHYNKETGVIKGVFDTEVHDLIPEPKVLVDPRLRNKILLRPNQYAVKSGKISKIADTSSIQRGVAAGRQKKLYANKVIDLLLVNGMQYPANTTAQQNIILNLSIMQHRPEHKVKIWCQDTESVWSFKEHGLEELLDIAVAFNSRREELSTELYSLI